MNKIKKSLLYIIAYTGTIICGILCDYFAWREVEHGGFPVFSLLSFYVGAVVCLVVM